MTHEFAGPGIRTIDDLHRAVRAISRHFATDTVVIIGSQAILLDWPDAPALMRISGEIDAYPGNIREWEAQNPGELPSEEINALFGFGSRFHIAFGFYIDGVDETTAQFPADWKTRAVEITVADEDRTIRVIAPCLEDLIVSKLHRLSPKDREFIRACHAARRLDLALIESRLMRSQPAAGIASRARDFLDALA